MNKQIFLLSSKMLELASNEFSNHGCNDLSDNIKKLIPDEWLEDMKQWNSKGTDPWPQNKEQIGDSSLMHYLSYKLSNINNSTIFNGFISNRFE